MLQDNLRKTPRWPRISLGWPQDDPGWPRMTQDDCRMIQDDSPIVRIPNRKSKIAKYDAITNQNKSFSTSLNQFCLANRKSEIATHDAITKLFESDWILEFRKLPIGPIRLLVLFYVCLLVCVYVSVCYLFYEIFYILVLRTLSNEHWVKQGHTIDSESWVSFNMKRSLVLN